MIPVTTKATYKEKEGIIVPYTKPGFELADVIVTYVPKKKINKGLAEAARRTFGAWGDEKETGIEYEDKIRKEAEQHFKDAWGGIPSRFKHLHRPLEAPCFNGAIHGAGRAVWP